MSLWLLAGVLLVGTLVVLYAVLIGFDQVRKVPVRAVALAGERELVVQYLGGAPGCGDPHDIEVEESDDVVVISAFVVARFATRHDFACPAQGVVMYQTVRLDRPLDGRETRDGARDVVVTVHDSLEELITEP